MIPGGPHPKALLLWGCPALFAGHPHSSKARCGGSARSTPVDTRKEAKSTGLRPQTQAAFQRQLLKPEWGREAN